MTVRSKYLTPPSNKAYRPFCQADRKTLKNPRKPRLLKYPLTNAPGAPKSSCGNTSRTSKKQKGATLRYNQSRHSRPEAVPKVRNDFPALAKNGTIAPFSSRLRPWKRGQVVIRATVRCSDATLAHLATACPSRPCWLSFGRYASLALAKKAANSRSAPEHMRTAHG